MFTAEERKDPVLIGRYWLMPDNGLVPNIFGGNDDDPPQDPPQDPPADDLKAQLDRMASELKNVRSEAAKYRTEAKELKEKTGNIDIDKYNAMLDKEAQLEKEKLEAKGNYEEALTEAQRRHEAALEQANSTTNQWKGMYSKQVIDNVLISKASSRAIDPEEVTVLIRARYNFSVTEDGKVLIKDKDDNVVIDKSGQPLNAEQVMDEFLNSRLHLCKAEGGGAGSSGNAGDSGSHKSDMTAHQRIVQGLKSKMS